MISSFLKRLAKIPHPADGFNPYYGRSKASQIRRQNLQLYLEKMQSLDPSYLLMGEAPGYKGCRLTGIPFSSEKLLSTHSFFEDLPFQFIHSPDQLESENSAQMVWEELGKYEEKPLIWNAYPFHPHRPNQPMSNRAPKKEELKEGKIILLELLELFQIRKILALGRKAEAQLTDLDIPSAYLRHPSYGGKQKFANGIRKEM